MSTKQHIPEALRRRVRGRAAGYCEYCLVHDDLAYVPLTGQPTLLYNPRRQRWSRHFRLNGARIEPLTASGRATERLLHLNDQRHITERQILLSLGYSLRR